MSEGEGEDQPYSSPSLLTDAHFLDLAVMNGVDVDFPRNLAKSVTTE